MIVHFAKIKTNKTEGSLKNVWGAYHTYIEVGHRYVQRRFSYSLLSKIKSTFPNSVCVIDDTKSVSWDHNYCTFNISLSDIDEAHFMLWASDGIEV